MSETFSGDILTVSRKSTVKFNLSLRNFIDGQMVTVGNGIDEIVCAISANPTITGLSRQCDQTFPIEKPHNAIDKKTAIIHHNL